MNQSSKVERREGAPRVAVRRSAPPRRRAFERAARRGMLVLGLSGVAPLSSACAVLDGGAPASAFSFAVRVSADDDAPVAGAEVSLTGALPLQTGASGEVVFDIRGREGERRPLTVRCPAEYQSPDGPGVVALHVLADSVQRPRYDVTCPRLKRTIVVAVRARNGADLPVLYLGQEIARTDASGAAHALLWLSPGESFRLTIDTSANDAIQPQSPSAQLAAGEKDDILVFDQEFTAIERKKALRLREAKPHRL